MDTFDVSDDEEDLLLITEYQRQRWMRQIVGGVLDKLDAADPVFVTFHHQSLSITNVDVNELSLSPRIDSSLESIIFTL